MNFTVTAALVFCSCFFDHICVLVGIVVLSDGRQKMGLGVLHHFNGAFAPTVVATHLRDYYQRDGHDIFECACLPPLSNLSTTH